MSHRLGRVVSDLSHSNSHPVTDVTDHSLRQQSATSNNEGGNGNAGSKAKKKLSLLISSVVSWTRSESSRETGSRKQRTDGGTGGRGRGLEIVVLAARKYVAMVEQLFTSSYSYSASSSRRDVDRLQGRRRPHTFTSARHAGGNANAAAHSSKRHRGRLRLPSAPASLRGSPATSGHLSVGESVTTSSEVSTMEELQSAIQAAIAHCKNSVAAAAGGDKQQQQQRKC